MKKHDETQTYTSLTGSRFKERFYQHHMTSEILVEGKKTTLSKKIWNPKDQNEEFEVICSIKQKAHAYVPGARDATFAMQKCSTSYTDLRVPVWTIGVSWKTSVNMLQSMNLVNLKHSNFHVYNHISLFVFNVMNVEFNLVVISPEYWSLVGHEPICSLMQ